MAVTTCGNEVVGEVKGEKLVLEIDLGGDYGFSSTGKTRKVASTGGFVKVPGSENISFRLNVQSRTKAIPGLSMDEQCFFRLLDRIAEGKREGQDSYSV